MNKELVIFDLDGTILYTLEDLAAALNYTLAYHGYPQRTLAEVRAFVGNGIRKLIVRSAPPETDDETIDRLHKTFSAYYNCHYADHTRPYDGIPELLAALRAAGVRTAVVSNKPDEAVKPLCEQFFPGMFDAAVGERKGVRRKPAPDSVYAVMEKLGIKKERSVYVGDSEVDIETAEAAGIPCISVDWGFRAREALEAAHAEKIVSSPEEILACL